MTAANDRLLTFGFTLNDSVNVLLPITLNLSAGTKYLPRNLDLFDWRKRRCTFGRPYFEIPQHLKHNVHCGFDVV